jgi:outer membrane protein assembly factor BamB/orotate phosphoribosyltransferase
MNFFRLIRSAIDLSPLAEEVRSQEHLWLADTGRQDKIRVQRDTNTIFLRSAVARQDLHINENQETCTTATAQFFPKALAVMTEFAAEMNCLLSRAAIVRLKPKSRVLRHIDEGSYYFLRDRFHLVLQSSTGSSMMSGGEQVLMREGELWWLDNKQFHESQNDSGEWRIHYIFDLLPIEYRDLAVNPLTMRVSVPADVRAGSQPPGGERRALPAVTRQSHPRELLFSAIHERGILRGNQQRLIAPDGASNRWLIDIRRLLMEPRFLDAAAELFWEECDRFLPFQVGAIETAGIPLLSAILMKSASRGTPVNGFVVKKERKTYGTGEAINGELTDAPILFVDDILNSGNSLEKARSVLEQSARRMERVFVLVDYENPVGKDWRARHAVDVHPAFHLSHFGLSLPVTEPRSSATFRNVWSFASPDPNFFHRVPKSFPATDGKRVYFGSDCGSFWCLDGRDGSIVWNFIVNAPGHKNLWSSPTVVDGKVYFGSYDGNVYCLEAETGKEVWRFIGADWVGSSPAVAPELDLLFIGLEYAIEGKRGGIAALQLSTGEKVWEHRTRRYTHASPAYWPERQLVACGSNDNELLLFDAKTGALHWRFETGPGGTQASIRHAPAFDVERGHLITGCANGMIYIVDVKTGHDVWSVRTDNTIYTVPLVIRANAYVGSTDKHMYVLDLARQCVRKKIFAGSKVFGPAALLKGRIYFGACNGLVYELDPETDEITGKHQLPDAITNRITYSDETGYFYALTYVNQMFAIERAPAENTSR